MQKALPSSLSSQKVLLATYPSRRRQPPSHSLIMSAAAQQQKEIVVCNAELATRDTFAPFGQLVSATDDGKPFDGEDAQLLLDQGTPRFYIMRLPRKGLTFDRITYHAKVSQCLGALTSEPWYLVVARPTFSLEQPPTMADLHTFRVPHGSFVKMDPGLWHAGPFFDGAESMDFYNLELSDTNVTDHNTHVYPDTQLSIREIAPEESKWWTATMAERER